MSKHPQALVIREGVAFEVALTEVAAFVEANPGTDAYDTWEALCLPYGEVKAALEELCERGVLRTGEAA
mgnify:FL=1